MSSLEEMLHAIQQRAKPKPRNTLPGLPPRPAVRGRLPSQKRSLPVDFLVEETDDERALRRYQEMVLKIKAFQSRRISKLDQPEESPYGKMPDIINDKGRWEHDARLEATIHTSSTSLFDEKFKWSETMDGETKKKLHVWCRHPDVEWELGSVKSVKGQDANILLSDGKVLTVSTENLLPVNPDILDGVDDLMQLGYLNEPSVLHCLKDRYFHGMTYTKAGHVLLAINPFRKVPLYENDSVASYKEKANNSLHPYAIADSAFGKMMREGANQSIIISGESGAGKTEIAKIAMHYLAALGGDSGIEHEVLQSNFILEAFGNAKTTRNDNSSRFGKLVEIHFHLGGKICGAKIQTFFLEKSRVVSRAHGERSYHVFYQLCAGAPALLKEKLNLKAAQEYEYLKQSDCLRIDGPDDAARFLELMEALNSVHISEENQENAFAMLAAVLWLGNIEFLVTDSEDHVEVVPNEGVRYTAKLLGCKVPELMLALSTHTIQVGNEEAVQKLTLAQAIDKRDTLAKSIYSCLFDWLVERINQSLEVPKLFSGRSINILDLYGFESVHKNSFEQFFINYANERLQQHIYRHLFKLEHEEYVQDGIDWIDAKCIDNGDCLNLFEKKPLGLLSLLDEEAASSKSTDLTFEYMLKMHLNGNPCFNGEREGAFQVCHYAGEVLYDTHGFLEKNRDSLPSDCIQLLLSCDCHLSRSLASRLLSRSQNPLNSSRRVSAVDSQMQSIATKFKGQLFNLMQQLESTTPHFIQCIMPNSNKLPGVYENKLVLQQLRYCGILELVRILKSGYSTRMTHQQFAERYGFLLLKNIAHADPLNIAVSVLQKFNILTEMYQVGYTKLFFRTGQIVELEKIRNHTIQRIIWVQKSIHCLEDRRRFQKLKKAATTLQSFIRCLLVRKNFIAKEACHKTVDQVPTENIQDQASESAELETRVLKAEAALKQKEEENIRLQDQASVTAELEMQVLKADAALKQKEEENNTLRKQLRESERICSEKEAKMKSMQDSWQKQVATSPMIMSTVSTHEHASSASARTPEGSSATHAHISNDGPARNADNPQNDVGYLVREFEQRKRDFDDEARVLAEARPGQSGSKPNEDLRKLKAQFTSWKKDYKAQLKATKAKMHKLAGSDGEKARKKCCPVGSDGEKARKKCCKIKCCKMRWKSGCCKD